MMQHDLDPRAAGGKRLLGKVCVVTGAGQGIGRATARRLAAEGGTIIVAERVEATGAETLTLLHAHGVEAIHIPADVSTLDAARKLMQETVERFGRIDVLVNVVGGAIWWQPYHVYTEEQMCLELERTLYTTMWCCHAVLPYMVERKSGSIVNLSSAVVRGGLYRTPYAIGKGGIEVMTKTLASEYGRHGIRVNAVSPGSTAVADRVTSRLTLRPGVVAQPNENTESYFREARGDLQKLALQRQGLPEEHAAVIAFLASDDAAYVTGQTIDCIGDP
jgi:dihydroxycyclohexadiene carboxylate dehydrogenase